MRAGFADRSARGQSRRGARRAPRRNRARQSEAQRHRHACGGSGARRGARPRKTPWCAATTLGPLHGLPIGIKDVTLTAGIRTTFGSPLFKDNVPDGGRRGGAAPQGRGRDRSRQDQHAGVRDRREHRQRPVRRDAQSLESGAQPGRLIRRLGGRGRDRHAADRAGHRLRLLDPHSGGVLRHRRHPPDARADAELPDAAGLGSGPGARAARPHRRRCRDDARCHGGLQPACRRSRLRRLGRARCAIVERACDAKGLRVAYASDIAGIGVDAEIDAICRRAAEGLRDAGATVEPVSVRRLRRPRSIPDLARRLDGRPAVQPHVDAGAVRRQPERQHRGRPQGHRARHRRGRADPRSRYSTASASCSNATMF